MSRTTTVRKYGKTTRKPKAAEVLFAQLPGTPVKPEPEKDLASTANRTETRKEKRARDRLGEISKMKNAEEDAEEVALSRALSRINLHGGSSEPAYSEIALADDVDAIVDELEASSLDGTNSPEVISALNPDRLLSQERLADTRNKTPRDEPLEEPDQPCGYGQDEQNPETGGLSLYDDFRVLTWDEVCPPGGRIEKIAEASYAEVYRITNAHGTSIIKVVRLESPIKAQTKAQERAGLVDEEPHSEEDMEGELRISEWLADIPGFVVYKERYMVKGKATKALLETHQAFHRRKKRQDPDMLQFYPSPSRYLDDTLFLVVELGDAGTALEDFELTSISQVWDIFLHTALALARAEDLIEFEHRDLHEGNLCIRQVRPPMPKPTSTATSEGTTQFGYSGLEVTILDYGLSRATNPNKATITTTTTPVVVAADLEKDLTLFQSTHAPQCRVYRQMRSYLIHADRLPQLPAHCHTTPYPPTAAGGKPISWAGHHRPYTNVLWLAYLYGYLVTSFRGPDRAELRRFRAETRELVRHLDPCAPEDVLSFPSAAAVVGRGRGARGETQEENSPKERVRQTEGARFCEEVVV
ncbi:hypothetical protein N658DRAFT_555338 [Parathielavia hyrcaniae]|uniref:non-specific serine/threonine protein kinase n=1 Tax=Parathielavia hyrcaniae TaxID=113614 RepID=A0AAN6QA87_9PEZI|nr:hypothetical protein N658DRAFT_555338 [Parathielavia hyrcaniae]